MALCLRRLSTRLCLVSFAKNAGIKTRVAYHRHDAATTVRTSPRSARFEHVSIANRHARCLRASRAPALRAFLGGRSIIVTQLRRPVLGNHARNASRNSPSPYPPYLASAAGLGRRRVGSARDQSERSIRLPAETCSALVAPGVTMFALYVTKLSVAESEDYVPKPLARSARSSRI